MDCADTLSVSELGVKSFCVKRETDADSVLEALLEEDGHADAVGGEADEREEKHTYQHAYLRGL